MNIAITGATGFVGTNLTAKLKLSKFRTSIFDGKENNLFRLGTLEDFLRGKDVVIHLAGINKDGKVKDIIKTNILGTKKLLDAISIYCPDAQLIFASSFQVYHNDDIFGLSKWAAEELIKDYVDSGLIKRALILRFSNIYGIGGTPFRNSVISTFAYLIKSGKEIVINGTGEQTRDFIYVNDAIRAISKAMAFDIKKGYQVIDVCSGRLTSINELVNILEKFSDKKALIRYNDFHERSKKVVRNYRKAARLLGWKPLITLKKGLRKLMV